MKEKLTLTVDREAIRRAKAFAKKQQVSLSHLVEEQFKRLGGDSFAERWYGKFKEPPDDPSDARLTYLKKKYLHD
jgi:hypothetical protein